MYILIHNSTGSFSIDLPEYFKQININSIYSIVEENDYLYKSNIEEFFLNKVSEILDDSLHDNVNAIIIDKNLGGLGWSRAIGLGSHIACTEYSNFTLNKISIIFTDRIDLDLEDQSLKYTLINNIFQTEGFYFRKYESIFSLKLDIISGLTNYSIDIEIKKLKPIEIEKINISSPYDSRHQTTNEWGAMRLASNFGIFDLIRFKYPKHLYFKYLSRFISKAYIAPDKSLHNLFIKILLIDDNADCGWAELLEKVHNCSVDKRVSATEVLAWQNTAPEKFKQYDLIYLDLYLEKGKSDNKNALTALKFIKGKFPHIPIVIFTASDKAWNLDEVLEKGADAMYIKESPIYYRSKEYSLRNYNDFKTSINYVYKKYNILKPYWLAIQDILTDNTFLSIHENGNSKFKQRIKERLEMFYGLLKRGLEQTEFNELRFHFSDYELAFITLWSILNEISEVSFIKIQPNISIFDSLGNNLTSHPRGNKIKYKQNHYKWVIKNQEDIFVEYTYNFILNNSDKPSTDNSRNFYKLTHEQKSCFLFSNNIFQIITPKKTITNYETTLFLQVAYLIERKNNLSNSINKVKFQQTLIRLNEIRNHLYLTHGSDISSGFYDKTEKEKRASHNIKPEKDIKELFELISFLLTGKENVVAF
jgi:CheY-like chemotaxis protein